MFLRRIQIRLHLCDVCLEKRSFVGRFFFFGGGCLSAPKISGKGETVGERMSLRPKSYVERENGRREGVSPPEKLWEKQKR